MKTPSNLIEIASAQATSYEFFIKTPSSFEEMSRCLPISKKNHPQTFIKIKLYLNHGSDNLMKPPQTLHNCYYLSHLSQFDDIFVDRDTEANS
jgi:hypothetical protein